ncbi:MAG TPA: protein phosphatase 2C domain-containing protein [Opitutaceae bacterium]|jgi:protein phosphatase
MSGIAWSGLTHRGRVRPNNEDNFLALTVEGHSVHYLGKTGELLLEESDFVFAVSDGMGGERSGEFASRFAVDRITRLLPRGFRLGASGWSAGYEDLLSELMHAIHEDLLQLGASYEECAGMGATLSLAWFTPGKMHFSHVGDSRIYALAREPVEGEPALVQLTHDHTHVGWLRRTGQISEREARSHPRKNALSQALGAGQQFLEPQIGAIDCRPGDRFLLCTDGVTEALWDRRLAALLATPGPVADLASQIVNEAVSESGKDNTTAIAIEIRG